MFRSLLVHGLIRRPQTCHQVISCLQMSEQVHQNKSVEKDSCLPEPTGHVPVMLHEVLDIFKPPSDKVPLTYLDMTLGAGGHTEALLTRFDDVTVYALDRDPVTIKTANRLRAYFGDRFVHLSGRFTDLPVLLSQLGVRRESFDGALFDLGASSMQFDSAVRGFSLSKDGPLDMRMDWTRDENMMSASDVVNRLYEDDLYNIIKRYGEEKNARKIARAIVQARLTFGRIKTTHQLAGIIAESCEADEICTDKLHRPAHPATKTFQALRIFVNNELNQIYNGVQIVHRYLKPGGICAAISFHSLEDRIIKQFFHGKYNTDDYEPSPSDRSPVTTISTESLQALRSMRWSPLNRKVTTPSTDEIRSNPRARSAKLRAAVRI